MADRTCTVPDCDKPHLARGYCARHYNALRPDRCKVDGCSERVYGRALCAHHWRKWKTAQPQPPCAVEGCPTPRYKRSWCQAHYRRWRLSGDPLGTDMRERRAKRADVADVFWSRVNKTDTCWLWTQPLNNSGYGTMKVNSRTVMAHRYAWEQANGPVPDGLELDHLCCVQACVRPDHLEPVTRAENERRKRARRA